MPPKVKVTKEDIVEAALAVVRRDGADALSTRKVAAELHISTHPLFTYYDTIDELKHDVYEAAKAIHRNHIEVGLKADIPFLGVGLQYISFAKTEPELYKLLYLTKPDNVSGGAVDSMNMLRDIARESVMHIYNIDSFTADCYFRDLWLIVFGFATLIVTDGCPYTDEQMSAVLTEVSLSLCKAYKEVPGLVHGDFDRDAIFRELVKK